MKITHLWMKNLKTFEINVSNQILVYTSSKTVQETDREVYQHLQITQKFPWQNVNLKKRSTPLQRKNFHSLLRVITDTLNSKKCMIHAQQVILGGILVYQSLTEVFFDLKFLKQCAYSVGIAISVDVSMSEKKEKWDIIVL